MLPGGVDVHTHLDADVGGLRSADDFESSTAAAPGGGVTTICDYAWQQRGQSLTAAIEDWKTRAAGRAHVDYGFHVIVGDASDQTLAEIPRLVDLGYPSLKVFVINEFGIGDQAEHFSFPFDEPLLPAVAAPVPVDAVAIHHEATNGHTNGHGTNGHSNGHHAPVPPTTDLTVVEREMIAQVMRESGGNKSKAATKLGLTRSQLYVRLRRYNLES